MQAQPAVTVVGNAPVTGLSEVWGLNNQGQVVGQEDTVFPIVWTPNTPNGSTGASHRLPLLQTGGPAEGAATAINSNGDAVGFADALDPFGTPVRRAVFWPAGGGSIQELGTLTPNLALPGTFLGNSRAFAINDNGVIVGESDSATGVEHAFVFDPAVGIMRDLGSLVPLSMLPGTPDPSRAFGINNQGDIVGEATAVDASGNLVLRAFLLPAGSIFMQDLGTLLPDPANPGAFFGNSSALSINDSGTIVGESDTIVSPQPAATAAFFQSGVLPSGMFPAVSRAESISQNDIVAGFIGSAGAPTSGFRFSATAGAVDLTTLVGTTGTVILRAVGINAAGQIAADADINNVLVGVLLTP